MTYFSIEIITRGERTLEEALKSIEKQSNDSFEIVCANSSSDPFTCKILDNYSVKHLEVGSVKHLRGRELAHSLSSGKVSLIMDSTRILDPGMLDALKVYIEEFDMVAIKEGSIGEGFWVNQARLYKNFSERNVDSNLIKNKVPSYVLPRLFKRDILNKTFISLRQNIPKKLFDSIGYGEHHLIVQEALSFSKSLYYYKETDLIKHYEDATLDSIYRKYKNYGKDQKILNAVPKYTASHLTSHFRKLNKYQIVDSIRTLPIIFIRSWSFSIGLLL